MGSPDPAPASGHRTVVVVRALGDPFEAEQHEGGVAPSAPGHLNLLDGLFFNGTVDQGALVRIESTTYICTRAGWRVVPE